MWPNGQTEGMNQTPGNALRCVPARRPTAWSTYLPWVEYVQNSLVSSVSRVPPFMAAMGYQPPLFCYQKEAAVPSVRAHLRRCWHVRVSLLHLSLRSKQ